MQSCRRFSLERNWSSQKGLKREARLKDGQLRLENQIAEAEDVVELAKTKVQFYKKLEDAFPYPVSRTNNI